MLVIAFGRALKDHLRPPRPSAKEAAAELGSKTDAVHQPVRLAGDIYETVARWQRARSPGRLDAALARWTGQEPDGYLRSLRADSEHAAFFLVPRASAARDRALRAGSAVLSLRRSDTGVAGLPLFILAAYFLLGTEMVAEDIEDPFGTGGDDLPLESYCATIETSVREILGPAAGASRG